MLTKCENCKFVFRDATSYCHSCGRNIEQIPPEFDIDEGDIMEHLLDKDALKEESTRLLSILIVLLVVEGILSFLVSMSFSLIFIIPEVISTLLFFFFGYKFLQNSKIRKKLDKWNDHTLWDGN